MEKNDDEPVPLFVSLSEKVAQQEAYSERISEVVNSAHNVPGAVAEFKSMFSDVLSSCDVARQKLIKNLHLLLLSKLQQKFPGQEFLIARLLYPHANYWLQAKRHRVFKNIVLKQTGTQDSNNALNYISNGDQVLLRNWLHQGYDPNILIPQGSLLFAAIAAGNQEAVYALLLYGADLYTSVDAPAYRFTGNALQFLEQIKSLSDDSKKKILEVIQKIILGQSAFKQR